MAYYSGGNHTFQSLIDNSENEIVKAFLKYKKEHWYLSKTPTDECFVEQMLYNEDASDIANQLNGFVAGKLSLFKPHPGVENSLALLEIMPVLGKIYKEMCEENKWDTDDKLEEWSEYD